MSSIPLPPGVRINGFAMPLQAVTRAHSSPFGGDGAESVVDLLQDRWTASVSTSATTPAEARAVEAWLNSLRGGVNTTPLHHHRYPVPAGTLGRVHPVAGLLADAAQGAASVTLATQPGATLLAGDMFRIGGDATGAGGLLQQCAADCMADANGVIVVPLANRLRRAITGLRRNSAATYVDASGVLQTAAANTARYQGGQLLVEPVATNQALHSSAFSNAAWQKIGTISVSENATTAPDGTLTSDTITFTGGATDDRVDQAIPVAAVSGSRWTYSVWLRGSGSVNIEINTTTGIGGGGALLVNLTPNWVRYSVSVTFASPTGNVRAHGVIIRSPGVRVVDVWGAQIEQSDAATSYIPTTTAAATRAADVINPVEWNRPARPFRLATRAGLRHVPGYAEGLALDFVEDLAS